MNELIHDSAIELHGREITLLDVEQSKFQLRQVILHQLHNEGTLLVYFVQLVVGVFF